MTGDDEWDGYLDGVRFGTGLGWNTEYTYDLTLSAGWHVFAFEVRDLGGAPTGIVADIVNAGNVITQTGGEQWKCSFVSQADFAQPAANTSTWTDAALCTDDPWGGQPTTLRGRGAQWVGCINPTPGEMDWEGRGDNPCATSQTRWYRLDFYVDADDIVY